MSKEAVRRFVVDGLSNSGCRQDNGGAEDVEIGKFFFFITGIKNHEVRLGSFKCGY